MYFSSAPARVCLYGEHQDYLGLRVIPAAIDLRLKISSLEKDGSDVIIHSADTNEKIIIPNRISSLSTNQNNFQSFLEAGILALKKIDNSIEIPSLDVEVKSDIPIASGLSSSAALLVSWIKHLDGILKLELEQDEIAEAAYDAEHNILGIPCGKMDQYSSSYGSIISLVCSEPPVLSPLSQPDFNLIVVDSNTPKLTSNVHGKKVSEIKNAVLELENHTNRKLNNISSEQFQDYHGKLSKENLKILEGVLTIKSDTETANKELMKTAPDLNLLGKLLTSQHEALRNNIGVSLPILDKIVEKGLSKGALGGKLTGAGLGGCVVLLFEKEDKKTETKLKKELGLQTWSVKIDKGALFQEK
jgi:galactokinase